MEFRNNSRNVTVKSGMRTEKVKIGDKKSNAGNSSKVCTISCSGLVISFESAVEAFDNLFKWTVFFRDRVVVCKPDNLCDVKIYAILCEELLGKKINRIAVCDEIPLALESNSFDALIEKVKMTAPEILAINEPNTPVRLYMRSERLLA